LQSEILRKAIEAKVPFFVDAPGAADFDQACRIARLAEKTRLVTTVGFRGRYTDLVLEARQYLGANPVPLALAWWLGQRKPEAILSAAELLWEQGCHFVDALRLTCGEVERVRALATVPGDAGGLVVQLEFTGGGVGVLTCTNFARPEPRLDLELMGDGWSVAFADAFATLHLAERDKTTILRRLNDPEVDQANAFLAAVVANDPGAVAAGYADALRTMAVCEAFCRSAREGRIVSPTELVPVP
jgi:predicted dehydrogenase